MPYKDKEKQAQCRRKYYLSHLKEAHQQMKKYAAENRQEIKIYLREYREKNPWLGSYASARARCLRKNHHGYKYYGGRGIQFKLTVAQIKKMWPRDRARALRWASIDRIDNDGDYEYSNCRFIEIGENSARRHKKT